MTTIAFCPQEKMLVADTVAVCEQAGKSYANKVWRIGDVVFAGSGDYGECLLARDWLRAGMPEKKPKLVDFSGIIVNRKTGEAQRIDDKLIPYPVLGQAAVGSGAQFAIGAMDAGATVLRAVEIARERDPNTGGRLKVVRFPC